MPLTHLTQGLAPFRSHNQARRLKPATSGIEAISRLKMAAALGIEARIERVFLWKSTEESHDADVARVREELADVRRTCCWLMRLARIRKRLC